LTSISLTAEAISPEQTASQPAASRYLLTISTSALTFMSGAESRQTNLRLAVCDYNSKGDAFQYSPRDLSRQVPDELYRSWQSQGIRNIFDYDAKPDDKRLRFAVLDEPSGALGSLDVPAHPREFGSIPGPVTPASSTVSLGDASQPANQPAPSVAPGASELITVGLTFRGSLGQSSVLDWQGDTLSYRGDLAVVFGAPAFFEKQFGAQFHCQSGNLVPNDATSTATPKLIFLFQSTTGHSTVVDLTGSEPKYPGNMVIDPSARRFFDQVWKLSHCTQP
jgi:hypothetical protein